MIALLVANQILKSSCFKPSPAFSLPSPLYSPRDGVWGCQFMEEMTFKIGSHFIFSLLPSPLPSEPGGGKKPSDTVPLFPPTPAPNSW